MTKKILIIGAGAEGKTALILQEMKEKYGNDIVLVTPQEANEQGLKMEDFDNLPTMKLTAPMIMEHPNSFEIALSGKESRRKRREQERKSNNNQ